MRAAPARLVVEKHKRSRFWAVRDAAGTLLVLAVYKVGAENVARLLEEAQRKAVERA